MKIKQCTAYNHKNCEISQEKWASFTRRMQSEDWLVDDTLVNDWHSFDCLHYNKNDGLVYAGLTAMNGDFFTLSPENGHFESLKFPSRVIAMPIKSFWIAARFCRHFYGGVATLSDVDIYLMHRADGYFDTTRLTRNINC